MKKNELSHPGQYGYRITTNRMAPDEPIGNSGVSNQNDQNVADACLHGGDASLEISQPDIVLIQ